MESYVNVSSYRRLVAAVCVGCLGALSACPGDDQQHSVTLVFPSQQLLLATASVQLQVFKLDARTDPCPQLRRDERLADPLPLRYEQTAAFPFESGQLRLNKVSDGRFALLAIAFNHSTGESFLRGCTAATITGTEATSIRIELEEFRGCCRAEDQRCKSVTSEDCYDGPASTLGQGPCVAGQVRCERGYLLQCKGQVLPVDEICDKIDNDCDGVVDDVARDQLQDNPQHCGACNHRCTGPCIDGKCGNASDAGSDTGPTDGGLPHDGTAGQDSQLAIADARSADRGPAVDGPAPMLDSQLCEPEWCDGEDNDCDRVPDNGEVCPDDTVANTETFAAGAYLLGTTSEGQCSADALQRFWPTLATSYLTGFGCYARWYLFRPSDQHLFYSDTTQGIVDHGNGPVATPPCGNGVGQRFGFDSSDALYYRCDDTLRRNNGELVAQQIKDLVAVLADGRTIVLRTSTSAAGVDDYVLLGDDGSERSRLAPYGEFSGELTPLPGATTVAGDHAYVAFQREYGQTKLEIVVYHLTPQDSWLRVRRASVTSLGKSQLVISDGTVFVRERDPLAASEDQIRAYLPGGTSTIVWREADATKVRAHADTQLLVGPP